MTRRGHMQTERGSTSASQVATALCGVVLVAVLGVRGVRGVTGAAIQPNRTATVTASAYNSTPAQTDDHPNEGAWGDVIAPGMLIVAVSPDLLDAGLGRGTELQIEGLPGTWTVLDRTASHHHNRIDIYMGEDVERAIEWGLKEVTIQWTPTSSASERP